MDGTLAPIVARPEDAAVPASTRALLDVARTLYGLVACVSGRRAADARRIVGIDALSYVGNHGLEVLPPGAAEASHDRSLEPLAGRVRRFAREAFDPALRDLGVRLEDKDVIWVLHWRGAPDEETAREALTRVAARAEADGLVPHWGRKVLEIRPPVEADKGTAVAAALDGRSLARALYAGDDVTDVDAFRKLRELESAARIEALCVGVRSSEGPSEIVDEADLVVDGPGGVEDLLRTLCATPTS